MQPSDPSNFINPVDSSEPQRNNSDPGSVADEGGLSIIQPSEREFDMYFTGEADEITTEKVKAHIARIYPNVEELIANPGSVFLAPIEKTISFSHQDSDSYARNLAFRRIIESVEGLESPQSADKIQVKRSAALPRWTIGLAMAAILAVGLPVGLSLINKDESLNTVSNSSGIKTLVADIGQTVTYIFPDGSSVLLAPGSKVQYGDGFGSRDRRIELHGEALFTVAQSEGLPFIISDGSHSVRVLGTTFSVRRYLNESNLTVVVAEGKVSVNSEILTSGDAITIDEHGTADVRRATDISSALSWTTGKLTFRRTPLHEAIPDLERWYGVSVNVDPALLEESLSGTFMIDEPVGTLKTIALLLQADLKQVGKRFVISKK